ncbi:hypothetical protein ERJ75_000668200 [Trypanosoma vivax]|nr:hypothetical protein ERJ75_000668200 [Trypanosoma vivax]
MGHTRNPCRVRGVAPCTAGRRRSGAASGRRGEQRADDTLTTTACRHARQPSSPRLPPAKASIRACSKRGNAVGGTQTQQQRGHRAAEYRRRTATRGGAKQQRGPKSGVCAALAGSCLGVPQKRGSLGAMRSGKKPRASSGRRDTTRCPSSGRCEGETGEARGGRGGRRTPGGRSTERENSRPKHARNSGKQAGEQKLGSCSPGRRRAQLDRAPVTRCEPVTRVGARVRVSACGRGCAAGEVSVCGPSGEVCGGGSNRPVEEARRQRWASRRHGWRGNAWQSDAKKRPD